MRIWCLVFFILIDKGFSFGQIDTVSNKNFIHFINPVKLLDGDLSYQLDTKISKSGVYQEIELIYNPILASHAYHQVTQEFELSDEFGKNYLYESFATRVGYKLPINETIISFSIFFRHSWVNNINVSSYNHNIYLLGYGNYLQYNNTDLIFNKMAIHSYYVKKVRYNQFIGELYIGPSIIKEDVFVKGYSSIIENRSGGNEYITNFESGESIKLRTRFYTGIHFGLRIGI